MSVGPNSDPFGPWSPPSVGPTASVLGRRPYPPSENLSVHGFMGTPSVPLMPSASSTETVRNRSSGAEKLMSSTRAPGS